ncbi:MAG: SUMF1/EgtB/PvdO family nonheme iron enzyme, partial [Phycisphaerae bacterium]|nr:SUMF1/EgtB/PvdO family nonheme iron enzyme [Phycisphaerae bacterium]
TGANDPVWLKLARKGNVFAAWWAPDAAGNPGPWSNPILTVVSMPASVYLGLATTSHANGTQVMAEYIDYAAGPLTSFPPLPALTSSVSGVPTGGLGHMAVREVIQNGIIESQEACYGSLASGAGTITDYTDVVLNIVDSGSGGHFSNDHPFSSPGTPGTIDNLCLCARGTIRIPAAGDYTFCVNSDDGFTLQFFGYDFKEVWGHLGEIAPFSDGHALRFPGGRAAADTLGVISLPVGSHPFILTYHEGGGGAMVEFSAAAGRKTVFDGDFRLVGHKAVGSIPVPGFLGDVLMTATRPGQWGLIQTLTDAQDALAQGALYGTNVQAPYESVNHTDPDTALEAGAFGGDVAFTNDTPGVDEEDFAIRVEGDIEIPQTGWYQIGFNSDDGASLRIPGKTWASVVADGTGNAKINGSELRNDSLTGWSFTAGKIYLTQGQHGFEAIMFERGGGAFFELFGRGYSGANVDPVWHLLVKHGAGFHTDDKDGLQLVSGTCPVGLMGDVNKDCVVNLMDFAEMAANWLVDCYQTPNHPSCWVPGHPGPDLVLIPGGPFEMGNSFNEGYADQLPVHTVLVDPFYMGRYEVTNQQYCDFLNAIRGAIVVVNNTVFEMPYPSLTPYCDMADKDTGSQIAFLNNTFRVRTKGGRDMGNDPMVCVSWYGAAAYCNWRSQQEGREVCYMAWNCDFSRKGYRLPTEAEWEYAARGGLSGRRFPWGNEISHSRANYHEGGYHPVWDDGIMPFTAPVGSFAPNGYGFDMAGNVWEWCNDWYSNMYYADGPQLNPIGPATGTDRVLRGGGWSSIASNCAVTTRSSYAPPKGLEYVGFRVVLDLD